MSISELKKATGLTRANGGTPTAALSFPQMLESFKAQIAVALPRHLNADRMARIALTEFRKNPALAGCDPKTIFASIIIAAQLGLEPGVMGQAYLVPYKGVCTLVPGWQGYVDLVSRAGRASVWTDAVRPGDRFDYTKGTSPEIVHEAGHGDDDAPFTHVYAVGRIQGAEWPVIEVWPRAKIKKHLAKYNKAGDKHYALQNERNLEMYARKVALLQVIKYMPKSVELQTASELDYAADAGSQTISVHEAIAGTFAPSGYEDERPEAPSAGSQQPEAPVIQASAVSNPAPVPDRLAEIFGLLNWKAHTREKWLAANCNLSLDEQTSKLEAELDK